jgi:prolyl 4-hydroxylase
LVFIFGFITGNLKKALDLTIELLSILPNHERALGNLAYYEAAIKNGTTEVEKSKHSAKVGSTMLDPEERDRYHMLCRNENLMSIELSSKLRCRYTNNNRNPLLLIAPLKEEEAYLSPRILLYREVLYDNEIEIIKRMAQPRVSIILN